MNTATEERPRTAGDLFEFRAAVADVPASAAEAVAGLAQEVARHARCHEPGTRMFAVLRDQARPTRFLFAAVYDDPAAERVHRASGPAIRLAALLLAAGVRLEAAGWEPIAGL